MFGLVAIILAVVLIMPKNNNNAGNIAAVVDGEVIYTSQVDERIRYNEFMNSVNEEYIKQIFQLSDQKQQIEKTHLPTERKNVLNELIESAVIRHKAKKDNNHISYENVKEFADDQYRQLKTDETQRTYCEVLLKKLSENKMTEEEYLSLYYDNSYDFYHNKQAERNFQSEGYDSKSKKTFDEQFDKYVKSLKKQYSIKVY